jgi:polar amino acid transport system substrate-binding protein
VITKSGLFFLFFFSVGTSCQEFIKLTIAYENKEQPPYYLGNTEEVLENLPGIAVEMIQRLEHHIPEIKIELKRFPWLRCLTYLQHGAVDGIFNASFKKDRLKIGAYPYNNNQVDPSKRITTISYSLYKLKTSQFILDELSKMAEKHKVGATRGYSIVGDLRKQGVIVDESKSTQNAFNKLLKGRNIAVAAQDVTGDYLLRKYPEKFHHIVKVSPPIKTKAYYLMLSNQFIIKHPELSEKIWRTIALIREEDLSELSAKYAR